MLIPDGGQYQGQTVCPDIGPDVRDRQGIDTLAHDAEALSAIDGESDIGTRQIFFDGDQTGQAGAVAVDQHVEHGPAKDGKYAGTGGKLRMERRQDQEVAQIMIDHDADVLVPEG